MADTDITHDKLLPVHIAGRFVGDIPESEWNFIVAEVHANPRLWKAQFWNTLRVAARVLGFGFISVPLGVFWVGVVFGWLGRPINIPGPGAHVGALLNNPAIAAAAVALAVGALLASGLKLGYVNFFARARSALLKEHLGIDDPGQCSVG